MENNVIIRHSGLFNQQSYDSITAEFIEAFEGFDGVSALVTTENGTKNTKIFLTEDNRIYLEFVPQNGYGLRVTLHCSSGSTEGVNFIYIDNRELNTNNLTYNIARTEYGVAFTPMPPLNSSTQCLTDGYFQCFFTTFLKQDGTRINGFVYSAYPNDGTSSNENKSLIITELHPTFEQIDFSKCLLGSDGNHTVLTNLPSYSYPLIAEHLYKKIMTENGKYGRIMINNRRFVSGSHLCLEMGSEEE